ncbi:unnamed protein product, partial [Hapterophycus canaliculatus]
MLWCDGIPHGQEARNFVESLLAPDQNKRPTAESAMSHPWMKMHGRTLLPR